MARAGSIIVGNHTYTAQDAAKTLSNLAELWVAMATTTPEGIGKNPTSRRTARWGEGGLGVGVLG